MTTPSTEIVVTDVGEPASTLQRGRSLRARFGLPGTVGLGIFLIIVATASFGPYLLGTDGRERTAEPFAAPRGGLPLGSDDLGRDLLAQLIVGARSSLGVGLLVAVGATVIAAVVGGGAGLGPRWLSTVLMRGVDVMLTLPFLPLLILVAAFLGQSFSIRVVLLILLLWTGPSRVIRAGVLTAWSRGHVEVARAMGSPPWRLYLRHASYVVAPLLIPIFVRTAMTAILLDASLAFLGLGDPSSPSWGTTLYWAATNSVFVTDAWLWWALPPGLAITVTVASLALVGVAVEERLNPALRGVR